MLFGVYAGIFFVASLFEVRQIQVCRGFIFFGFRNNRRKKCCEFEVDDLGIVPKKDNLQNL